ncbi:glycosyltransferase family 2 protein [Fictibacillus barbaricus]|uniref:Glycosyltransferase involved in cell wall biosynthesis n=1 Tax=Fictibacillus barbaricus TaxID=182136 RepID=A0ABU1TXX4_9BACL|nr:glycosyltransferase [Fictibacillus barbaricus]MDR7072051.1 glycosyltransferase involved in cell wall biosynthesis [Fictibacillus barbaricus]
MKLGVVLPVYHQERDYIFECIESIEKQTFRDFKLIIVLDGPNEETVKAIKEASKRLTIPYQIIDRKVNKGISPTLNEGFQLLQDCPYFTWISSDNRHDPIFLERLVTAMDNASPETVLVYSFYRRIDQHGIPITYTKAWYEYVEQFMTRKKEDIFQNCFIGASFLFKRDAFNKAGGYRENFPNVQDHDFWIRLLQHGDFFLLREYIMEYRFNGRYALTTNIPPEQLTLESMASSIDVQKQIGKKPKVSVVLFTHNQVKTIKQALNSVLQQSFKDFQLVILDDGSKDHTADAIHLTHDSRMIPLLLSHRGKVKSLEIALDYCIGEFVLFMSGEDWLDPQALEMMVHQLNQSPAEIDMLLSNHKVWHDRRRRLIPGAIVSGQNYGKLPFNDFNKPYAVLYRASVLNRNLTASTSQSIEFDLFKQNKKEANTFWLNMALYHKRVK